MRKHYLIALAMMLSGMAVAQEGTDLLSYRATAALGNMQRGLTAATFTSVSPAKEAKLAVEPNAPAVLTTAQTGCPEPVTTNPSNCTQPTASVGCTTAPGPTCDPNYTSAAYCTMTSGPECTAPPLTNTPGCTSVPSNCSATAVAFCTVAPVGSSCINTSLGWDQGCTSVSQCNFTNTRGCQNNTYPQACWYTVQTGTDCTQNTQTTHYTCGTGTGTGGTCAPGCVQITFRLGECRTNTPYCQSKTLGGSNCTSAHNCTGDTWNVDCTTTFGGGSNCSKAGACLNTVGVGQNCLTTKVEGGVNICGVRTSVSGAQSVTTQVCHVDDTDPNGDGTGLTLSLLLLGSVVARRFGII